MLYNVVLVSAVHQHESTISTHTYIYTHTHIHTSPPFSVSLPPSHPSRPSQSTKLSSLCYATASHWLSILHMVVYMFQCQSLYLYHDLLPLLYPQVYSLCLCFHCSPAYRFISTIFLNSINVLLYLLFSF